MTELNFTQENGQYVSQAITECPCALYIRFEENGGTYAIDSSNGEEWAFADETHGAAAGDTQRYCINGLISGEKVRVRCNMRPAYAKVIS